MKKFNTKYFLYGDKRIVSLDPDRKLRISNMLINETVPYLVNINYFDANDALKKQLAYTITIKYLGQHNFVIDKFDCFYNKREPTLIIEQLIAKINKTLYPMDVTLDSDGYIAHINNMELIVKRWIKMKQEILKEYTGTIITTLLKKVDNTLENSLNLTYSFQKDMFWSLFLHLNNINFDADFEAEKKIIFPFKPYALPLAYKGLARLNGSYTPQGTLEAAFEGFADLPKDKKTGEIWQSMLSIETFLEKETRLPLWMQANIIAFDKETNENKQKIQLSMSKQKVERSKINFIL